MIAGQTPPADPGRAVPRTPDPFGPTPDGARAVQLGARTEGRLEDDHGAGWDLWWNLNSAAREGARASTPDAGPGRAELEQALRDHGARALLDVLQHGADESVVRDALIALARLPASALPDGAGRDQRIGLALANELPSVSEAAMIGLALRGGPKSRTELAALVLAEPGAADLVGRERVDARTRAAAAYALGLASIQGGQGGHGGASRAAEETFAVLGRALTDATATTELHAAALIVMGLLPLSACTATEVDNQHVCAGIQIHYLADYLADPEKPAGLRAHAASALARAAVHADESMRQAVAGLLVDVLDAEVSAGNLAPSFEQGLVIALGLLGDGDRDAVDRGVRRALERVAERGDPLSRRMAWIASARVASRPGNGVGDESTRADLARSLGALALHADDGLDSWGVLALGLLADETPTEEQRVLESVQATLRTVLANHRRPERTAAACVAAALAGERELGETILERFQAEHDPRVRQHAAYALEALAAEGSEEALLAVLPLARGDAALSRQIARSLAELRCGGLAAALCAELAKADERHERIAVVLALGESRAAEAVAPLAALLVDPAQPADVRGAAARALGTLGAGGEDVLARLTPDLVYSAMPWTLQSPFEGGFGLLDLQ